MQIRRHDLMGSGGTIDLEEADVEGRLVKWLVEEALEARSWTDFQQRTAHGTIEQAKARSGDRWEDDLLYRLQLDLMGQIGVSTGELRGELSVSFGALLLQALCLQESSRLGLLLLVAAASREERPLEPDTLPSLLFELHRRRVSPFGYVFDLRPPSSVSSEELAEDYATIEDAGLVVAHSPIRETLLGKERVDGLALRFRPLLPAVRALVANVEVPAVEELFARQRAEAFAAAI